jgi:hypothetical protein
VTTVGSAALGAPSTGPTTTTPLASVPTFVPGLVTTTSVVGANDPAVLGTTNGLAAPSVTIAQSAAHSSGAGAGPVVGMLLVIGLSCAAAVLYLRRARPLGGERGWSR